MEGRRHFNELWVIFTPSPRLGRKVSFASDNKETLLVSLPLSRTQLEVQDRDVFNKLGEATTHDATYSGVKPLPWGACPKLHSGDKAAILGSPPPAPSNKLFDTTMGLPLFWQERKSTELWGQILKDLRAKAVFDASPGSGQLARACLEQGIQYTGVAKNAQHAKWLNNILDRYALSTVAKNGTAFYDTDLATLVKEHFQDIADLIGQQDLTKDSTPQDDYYCAADG